MLNWAALVEGSSSEYAWPPFQHPQYQVSRSEMEDLREPGFDFVRLTVDPGVFIQALRNERPRPFDVVVGSVRRFLAAGLGVFVDLHPNPQHPDNLPESFVRGMDAPAFLAYRDAVAEAAAALAPLAGPRVALELMNEPQIGPGFPDDSPSSWPPMLRALHDAARARAPGLTLVLSGDQGSSLRGAARRHAPDAGRQALLHLLPLQVRLAGKAPVPRGRPRLQSPQPAGGGKPVPVRGRARRRILDRQLRHQQPALRPGQHRARGARGVPAAGRAGRGLPRRAGRDFASRVERFLRPC